MWNFVKWFNKLAVFFFIQKQVGEWRISHNIWSKWIISTKWKFWSNLAVFWLYLFDVGSLFDKNYGLNYFHDITFKNLKIKHSMNYWLIFSTLHSASIVYTKRILFVFCNYFLFGFFIFISVIPTKSNRERIRPPASVGNKFERFLWRTVNWPCSSFFVELDHFWSKHRGSRHFLREMEQKKTSYEEFKLAEENNIEM